MLKYEYKIYHDLVVFDFISHYFNSSLMLTLELFWIYTNCYHYKYFIYHTPDVFFNVNYFYLQYIKNSTTIYEVIAQMLYKNRVLRSNRSRFYVPYSIYNHSHYPPQPNGPLIILSLNAIKKIINSIDRVKFSFWMDDVFLAFLLKLVNITTHHLNNAISLYPVQIKKHPSLSFIVKKIIYIHSLPPGAILFLMSHSNKYYSSINNHK